jgi:hypothetical protein
MSPTCGVVEGVYRWRQLQMGADRRTQERKAGGIGAEEVCC